MMYLKVLAIVLLIDGTFLWMLWRLFGGCFVGPCYHD